MDEFDMMLGDDLVLGDEYYDEDEVGFIRPIGRAVRRGARAVGRGARAVARTTPVGRAIMPRRRGLGQGVQAFQPQPWAPQVASQPPMLDQIPGVGGASLARIPLGFGSFTFTSGTATSFTFTARPQKPVRPRRLWIDEIKASDTAVGALVNQILVGTDSMLASAQAVPAGQFARNAFSTGYQMFKSAVPGIDVTVICSLTGSLAGTHILTLAVSMDVEAIL